MKKFFAMFCAFLFISFFDGRVWAYSFDLSPELQTFLSQPAPPEYVPQPSLPTCLVEVEVEYTETTTITFELGGEKRTEKQEKHFREKRKYSLRDVDDLACGIYAEVGSNRWPDELLLAVGDVILTRVADDAFSNTIRGVLTQCGQYQPFFKGFGWPAKASRPTEQLAVARCRKIAEDLLAGRRHSRLWGKGYVFQANFRQGGNVVKIGPLYFGTRTSSRVARVVKRTPTLKSRRRRKK